MADKKIEDATPDTQVTGVEKLPVSDAGVAKCLTVAQIKDYALAQIAALASASGIDLTTDGVYLLKGGALKPVASATLAAAVLDYGFGKVAVASMNGNEVVGVKDANAQKTITVSQLKTWLEANMTVTTDVNIGAKDAAGVLGANDLLVIAQGGANKKLTLTNLVGYAHLAFKDYVTSLTAVQNLNDTDVLYVVNGTTAKKCTVAQLKTIIGAGDVTSPDTTTAGNIPAWDNANKRLTNGYGVAGQIDANPSATKLVTEAAAATAIGAKVDKVTGKGLSTNDYSDAEKAKVAALSTAILAWESGKAYAVGDFCRQNGNVCRCVVANSDVTFDATHWAYVPSYPATGGDTTKYLRNDGTWNAPPQSTDFTGATGGETPAAGTHGLVPAPTTGDVNKFLKGDGTWAATPQGDVTGPATTTENKIPQWDATSKRLKDGLETIDAIPSGEATEADLAKLARYSVVEEVLSAFLELQEDILEVSVLHESGTGLPTAGKIPKFYIDTTGSMVQNAVFLVDGYGVRTSTDGLNERLSDTDILTEKAAVLAVQSFIESTKPNDVEAAETPAAGKELYDRTHYTFNVQTGQTVTFALPTFRTGKARDFRVAFNQTKAGDNTTTTVTFTGTGTIISKEGGASNTLTLTYDTETTGTEYHVLHFFDMADNLVCVKEV